MQLFECPVSFITPQSMELVKLANRAEKQDKTLGELLGSDAAWIEDVEDLIENESRIVSDEHDKAIERDRERDKD